MEKEKKETILEEVVDPSGAMPTENIAIKNLQNLNDSDNLEEEEEEGEVIDRSVAKTLSPGRLVLKRFFRSKLSMVGVVIIFALFAFSIFGPFFSPWGETEVDDSLGPVQYMQSVIEYKGADGVTYKAFNVTYTQSPVNTKAPPSKDHWLGTDGKGMDVLTRLMYGGRISLSLGFLVVFLQTALGVLLGGLAGYFGKWVDMLIMRIVDIFNCLPTLPILLIASAVLDANGIDQKYRIYFLMVILTIFGWTGIARMVRGQILSLREQEYMVAAEAAGLPVSRKIFNHLVPNVMPQLLVSMTLSLGGVILSESTMSYLGLGVPMPYAAWGTMISAANDPVILSNFFNIWVPPGIMIVLAVLAFNFIGDGLRDAYDPKSKR